MPSGQRDSYSRVAQWLHWAVAGAVAAQYVLANLAESAEQAGAPVRALGLLAHHKSVGISILFLAGLRLAWRLRHPPPPLPAQMPVWQARAARTTHWLLYALLLLTPLTGWLMSSASAYSVSWFNLLLLPDLVAPDEALKATLHAVHEASAGILFLVAVGHLLAALKHGLMDRDGVFSSMASTSGLILFLLVIAGVLVLLTNPDAGGGEAPPPGIKTELRGEAVSQGPRPAIEQQGRPAPWRIDHDASHIRFIGDQAGAPFTGVWLAWTGDIHFDPSNLAGSYASVRVQTRAVETQDAERNGIMQDTEWFDTEAFPEARFEARQFMAEPAGGFRALGDLAIKGLSTPVQLVFEVSVSGNRRRLSGVAELDRLQLGLGTGEWADTDWVGQTVRLEFLVHARVADEAQGTRS